MKPLKRSYRPPYQRASQLPTMRLTARDVQMLEIVYDYHVLTQVQLEQVVCGGRHSSRITHRLALLFHHGYLGRRFIPPRGSRLINGPILYILDRKGAQLLRAQRGERAIKWTPDQHKGGGDFFSHTVALSQVRLVITHSSHVLGYHVSTWHSESDLKANYDHVTIRTPSGKAEQAPVVPDSYFVLSPTQEPPKRALHFFVELDRGTMALKRFRRKVAAYTAYVEGGGYAARYGTHSVRVLTITDSLARLRNLKRATEAAGGKNRFWFALLSDLTPETVLTAPIWHVAARSERAALVENHNAQGRQETGSPLVWQPH